MPSLSQQRARPRCAAALIPLLFLLTTCPFHETAIGCPNLPALLAPATPFQSPPAEAQLQHVFLGTASYCGSITSRRNSAMKGGAETLVRWPGDVYTVYGRGLIARLNDDVLHEDGGSAAPRFGLPKDPLCTETNTSPKACSVWIEREFWSMKTRWYRRVLLDDVTLDADASVADTEMRQQAMEVAYRTGLEREPAMYEPPGKSRAHGRVFLPTHYLPFVTLDCSTSAALSPVSRQPDSSIRQGFRSAREMSKRKIVSVGDLHGDLYQTALTFHLAGIIDVNGTWTAGNHTIFVQTGDIVDRGHDTIALFGFLERLKQEAFEAGGEYIQLMGNHELMNIGGDLRFVSPEDVASFGTMDVRRRAFQASGFIGRHLFRLPLVHRVGRTIFAHGGVSERFSHHGIDGINGAKDAAIDDYVKETDIAHQYVRWPLFADDGPVWFRGFAEKPEPQICPQLRRVLNKLGADRMVVGHTVQLSGKILVRCDARFIVTDVGISRVYGGNVASVEIVGGKVWAVYASGRELISDGFQS